MERLGVLNNEKNPRLGKYLPTFRHGINRSEVRRLIRR